VALRSARPRDLVQLRTALGALPAVQALRWHVPAPLLAALAGELGDARAEHAPARRARSSNRRRISCATAA
jgi:DNA mismatch repair protein MutS